MHRMWSATIDVCEAVFGILEKEIPPPIRVPYQDGFQYRYGKRTPQIVVVQKMARIITGLQSMMALLRDGHYQEVGALWRMLDEFRDDVFFMSEAVRTGEVTPLHERFMNEFFQEEFDNEIPIKSTQKRDRIARDQIQAAIARVAHSPMNPSDTQELYGTLAKANSGYIHGASEHILDMYDGSRYQVRGLLGTPRQATCEETAWSYFHRSLVTVMYAAMSFRKDDLVKELYVFRERFEREWGRTDWEPPEKSMRKLKQGRSL